MPRGSAKYIIRNPDGTVSAEFSGHVRAAGLDLIAAGTAPAGAPNDSKIIWHRNNFDGAAVAEIVGTDGELAATNRGKRITLTTQDNGLDYASVGLRSEEGDSTDTYAYVEVDGQIRYIVRGDAASSFLQMAQPQITKADYHYIQVPTPGFGGGNRWISSTYSHNLFTPPKGIIGGNAIIYGSDTSTGQDEVVSIALHYADSNNFRLLGVLSNGATTSVGPGSLSFLLFA